MRTIETKVYQYNELSESAKQFAINSLRDKIAENRINCDSYDYRGTLEEIEKIFEIKVYDWRVGYPTYFRFEFKNLDDEFADEPKYLLRYLNWKVLPYIKNSRTYYTRGYHNRRTSRIMCNKEYFYCLTGCWCDWAVDNALNHLKDSVLRKDSPREFVENMLSDFFNQWEEEYNDASSDEYIEERFMEEDYEFLESGKPYLS